MERILLVEDEVNIRRELERQLNAEGFEATSVGTCADAQRVDVRQIDVILLDWLLPDGKGIDLLKVWRKADISTPVIMLTAKSQYSDRIVGLELGADDYLTKPFDLGELIARIRVQLRRGKSSAAVQKLGSCEPSPWCVAGIEINDRQHTVTYKGAPVTLTKMEFDLLRLFVSSVGVVFTREELLNKVWGYECYPTTRTVDNHILQLRKKFGAEKFQTVRSLGYKFVVIDGDDKSAHFLTNNLLRHDTSAASLKLT